MDYSRTPHAPPPGLLLRDVGLLILRWCAGLALLFFHAWEQGVLGWKHVWQKEPWAFAVEMADRGFPLPEVVAAVVVVAAALGSVFLLTGLLCRVSAAVLLVCSLCALFLYDKVPDTAEKLILYSGIYLVLVLCGPGRFSMDALFTGRRAARR